jgi:hypothetical protein
MYTDVSMQQEGQIGREYAGCVEGNSNRAGEGGRGRHKQTDTPSSHSNYVYVRVLF